MKFDLELLLGLQNLIREKMEAEYPVGELFLVTFMKGKIKWEDCSPEEQVDLNKRYIAAVDALIEHAQAFKNDETWWENLQHK